MPINKVIYGDTTLLDLSDSTLQSSDELVSGVTAYDRSGTLLTGSANYMPLIDNATGDMVLVSNADGEAEESSIGILDVATITDIRALDNSKQDNLVSGTNIKTVNSNSLLGSGDVTVQETLVSGTNIKTINSTTLLGSGDFDLLNKSGTQTYNIAGTTFTDGTVSFTITIT